MHKHLLVSICLVSSLFALTSEQKHNLLMAKQIGKITVTKDNRNFEDILPAIMMRESSARSNISGDKGKSLGVMQIQVITAREVSKQIKSLTWVLSKSDKYIKHLLLHNVQFNLLIATQYLRINYKLALRRHYSDPMFSAISRYNGGWHNHAYYNLVMKNLKQLKKRIKQ